MGEALWESQNEPVGPSTLNWLKSNGGNVMYLKVWYKAIEYISS